MTTRRTTRVAVGHRTTYRFDRPVLLSPHVIRLRPAPSCRTPVVAYALGIEPAGHTVHWQQDPFGNDLARVVFANRVTELSVAVDLVVDLVEVNPFDFFVEPSAERFPLTYDDGLALDLATYLAVVDDGPRLGRLADELRDALAGGPPTIAALVEINHRVAADVAYTTRMEPGVQSPDVTIAAALGSCRDSAWLLVQLLRRLGLAARFVSGYLIQLAAPDGPTRDGNDLHAWCEVFVPGAGWIGLDPTSGLLAGVGHLPLSCTPRPSSAAPIEGTTEPCEVTLEVIDSVTRIGQDLPIAADPSVPSPPVPTPALLLPPTR